ncbi:protein phosphatase 1, regulatory subunit 3Ca [Brachyhypopomus gauderio]|uniref:protein phosphatase 1, regulatory subunit 3Ca n=1 Tax=Brachyhypopomus gauderio TaxID=698409 RepID=UPI004042EBFB
MISTSVLHLFERPMPGPAMPVDVAVQLYIAHSPPLRSFLSTYEECRAKKLASHRYRQPLRPCLSARAPPDPPRLDWQPPRSKTKKKVVFADSRGMSLTAVHVFSPSDSRHSRPASSLQFDARDLEEAVAGLCVSAPQSRVLDFSQPAADYLDFRRRLTENHVCLESCSLQERTLTGTVAVRNLAFEKSVHVRVTFDSWESHRDVACTYMNNVYGCRDTDTFSFTVELPVEMVPQNKVEFCVSYTTGGQTYWDNNDGRNYGLVTATLTQNDKRDCQAEQKKTQELQKTKGDLTLHRFGNPRTCKGFVPKWQSWGCIKTSAPSW